MDIKSGPVTWSVDEVDEYSVGGESTVHFKSFLGEDIDTLHDQGFKVKTEDDLLLVRPGNKGKPELVFQDKYKNLETVPFQAVYEPDDLWIWHDPMRNQFITTFGKYDFTFYRRASGLFASTKDLVSGFSIVKKDYDEQDVDRYYFLVEQSISGKYTVTIGRHKDNPKKEKRYKFFAGSVREFFEMVVKCLDDFMKELLSKDVYIEEKEDKRTEEELGRED